MSVFSRMARRRAWAAIVLAFLLLQVGPAPVQAADQRDAELRRSGLVEPTSLEPGIRLDMRYATTNNFTGVQVYPSARCYLRADIAKRVVAAHRALTKQGLGLKLYDCYRPFSVQ